LAKNNAVVEGLDGGSDPIDDCSVRFAQQRRLPRRILFSNLEGVISPVHNVERGSRYERREDGLQLTRSAERVAAPLDEQHRPADGW